MMGIMSVVGRVFGSEDSVGKIIDKVSNGLDTLSYTDQEKEINAMAERAEARRAVVEWIKNSQGQNLARRILALAIGTFWLGCYGFSVFFNVLSVIVLQTGGDPEWAKAWAEVSRITRETAHDVSPSVTLILTFYFAAPHIGEVVGLISKNKKESP